MSTLGSPLKRGANTRTSLKVPTWCRNFRHRLLRPAAGNGRIQRAAKRALEAYDGTCSTSDVIEWAYARRLLLRGERRRHHFYVAVHYALASLGCIRIGRSPTGRGRPWIWQSHE
jgi:hypothetical protein